MSAKTVIVNVTSDVACPWCWVGKRAIEVAAANLNASNPNSPFTLELRWKPFELSPEIKSGAPVNYLEHIAKKFGNPRLVEQWSSHPESIPMNRSCAASNLPDIEFRFSKTNVRFSTYRAHLLLTCTGPVEKKWAAQNRLKEALLRRTHMEGKNLDLTEELTAAAQEAGVASTQQEVEEMLSRTDVKAVLDRELRESKLLPRFDGVPYFTFSNGTTFSGGQPVEVFEAVLTEVLQSL